MEQNTAIYESSWKYALLHKIARHYYRKSFRHYKCTGKENIPDDGVVIFICNHCDALMDPLAICTLDSTPKVFVARADIFNSTTDRILSFLKIMPIHRQRDGIHNVTKTEETIGKAVDVLAHGTSFAIMPEGKHRPMHSLMPFGKGLSRIALGACRKLGDSKPVYIVPVGCEYGDYFRFRSTLLLQVGKPVNVTDYVNANPESSENDLLQGIRSLASDALRKLILYIPDDKNYNAVWALTKISSSKIRGRKQTERFEANLKAIDKILSYKKNHPEKAAELFDRALQFEDERRKADISLKAFRRKNSFAKALRMTVVNIFLLPLFLLCAGISLPAWGTAELLACIPKDAAFRNSLRCVALLVVWSMGLILALIPAPFFTYDYFERIRQNVSAWRLYSNDKLFKQYETLYSCIGNLPDLV